MSTGPGGTKTDMAARRDVMDHVKLVVGSRTYADIEAYIGECGDVYGFRFVDAPIGQVQNEGAFSFKKVWIDQSTGYVCDDYYGTICILLREGQYLCFSYNC